jgi:TfoX/Sxy family transcriptional regulator of competence genes
MAYDEQLANRVRETVAWQRGIVEKKMFGGLAFMLRDKMFCGIVKDDLMVRVLEEQYEQALSQPHARPMDFTGKVLRGFVFVNQRGINSQNKLATWIEKGFDFVLNAELTKKLSARAPKKSSSRKSPIKKSATKRKPR